ncbi:MAG: PorT family protein [Cyclobacteriaceae bacterium]|nr:PorT family protein [Cyclobacteriaceae bacterium]
MKNRYSTIISALALTFIFIHSGSVAQTFIGLKAGANASKAVFDNEVFEKFHSTKIKPGFTVGAVFLLENKERYGLYAEFLYSQKGKRVESTANEYESNTATYNYFDLPVLFRIKFKQEKFDWYLQLGPQLSYWLSGKGTFDVYQPDRDIVISYDYKVNFGEPINTFEYLNAPEANRTQVSLALGGGAIWNMKNANYLVLDMRLSFGHTYMGEYNSAYIPNIGLTDNLEYTNRVLSVSAIYYFDVLEKFRLSKNKYRKR